MECNEQCKYYSEKDDSCIYMFIGNGNPKYAPCYTEPKIGKWKKIRINPHMLMCSECKGMYNKDLIYDYYYKDPLIFKYCPQCGAKMEK